MPELVLRVPGEPVPQNTGKVGRWRAKDGREGVTIRQPAKVRNFKVELQDRMYRAACAAADILGDLTLKETVSTLGTFFGSQALSLSIEAVFSLPVSKHRKREPLPRSLHTGRYGNCDNLTKAIGDAGEGVLWDDDGQIAELHVYKYVGAQGEAPYTEIRVRPLSMGGDALRTAIAADKSNCQASRVPVSNPAPGAVAPGADLPLYQEED